MERPLELRVKTPSGRWLLLSVSINDSVLGVRQLLSELPIVCRWTNYTLQLCSRTAGTSDVELNEYEDLVSYEGIAEEGSHVEMRCDMYNAQQARFQVRRFRELLSAPPMESRTAKVLDSKKQSRKKAKAKAKKAKAKATKAAVPVPEANDTSAAPAAAAPPAAKETPNPSAIAATNAVVVAATAAVASSALAASALSAVQKAKGIVPTAADTATILVSTPEEIKAATQKFGNVAVAPIAQLSSVYPLVSPFDTTRSAAAAATLAAQQRFPCVDAVTFSGWNPPPKPRALLGDLFYLEVVTLERQTLHVTACPDGFYINETRGPRFDPTPASPAHVSPTLFDLIDTVSAGFKKQWAALLEQGAAAAAARAAGSDVVDPTFAFLATPWQTGAAALAPTEQSARARWCVQSAASKASEAAAAASAQGKKPAAVVRRRQCADHTYDRNRAESDLTNETMGVSIGLGMACETQPSAGLVRDWNEELQCCREMPANTVHASIARSRALCKVLSDFETVATECAVAVAHGHVPPINPLDAPDAHVYVHNNVFFSLAVDGRGTYETCGGDAAAYSAASHDLRGVMELSRADVAGLHTLATAVVDYMGKRIVAQSIIPGILHGEAASSLVYGSVDHGKTVYWNEEMHGLMSAAAAKLHIADSVIAVPEFDEEAEAAELAQIKELEAQGMSKHQLESQSERGSVKWRANPGPLSVVGPVEGKGIIGSDGRYYVLDIIRTTPRDLNYCAAATSIGGGQSIPGNAAKAEEVKAAAAAAAKSALAESGELADAEAAVASIVEASQKKEVAESAAALTKENGSPADDVFYTAVLRPELVAHYVQYRANRAKMIAAAAEAKERKQRAAAAKVAAAADAEAAAPSAEAEAEGEAASPTGAGDDFVVVDGAANAATPAAAASAASAASTAAAEDSAEPAAVVEEAPVRLNTNVFTQYRHGGTNEERDADRATVMDAALFLKRIMIPTLLRDIRLQKAFCVDGESLCDSMHLRGVNLRYLGTLAALAAASEGTSKAAPLTPFALEICEAEMVARSFRKLLWSMLGANKELLLAPAISMAAMLSRLLSCEGHVAEAATEAAPAATAGRGSKGKGGGRRGGQQKSAAARAPAAASPSVQRTRKALDALLPSRDQLWADIRSRVEAKYGYTLKLWPGFPDSAAGDEVNRPNAQWRARANRIVLLRRVCQLVGVVVEAVDFDWGLALPISASNIADLKPVVKSCSPKIPCPRARDLLERGRAHLSAGRLQIAGHLVQEALTLLYQVCGASHRDTAQCCSTLATVLYHMGDVAAAVSQQQRAVVLFERIRGPDHPDTAHAHGNLALFLHSASHSERAVTHMRRCLELLEIAGGAHHAEAGSIFLKMGAIYRDAAHVPMAISCYFEAQRRQRWDLNHTVACLHAVALSYMQASVPDKAVKYQKNCYQIQCDRFGADDRRSHEAKGWLTRFTKVLVEQMRVHQLAQINAQQRLRLTAEAEATKTTTKDVQQLQRKVAKRRRRKGKKGKGGKGSAAKSAVGGGPATHTL